MITHKVRIYPNQTAKQFFEEQFEFARRDYNRQLEMFVRGIEAKKIDAANWSDSLRLIRDYCYRHFTFYNAGVYHFSGIIGWNTKRLTMCAKALVKGTCKPKFKSRDASKRCFKMLGGPKERSPYEVLPNRRLSIRGLGRVKMAEPPRFPGQPISVEIVIENDRYYACLLFACDPQPYAKTGKAVGVDVGIHTLVVGVDQEGQVLKFDLKLSKNGPIAKRINHYERLLSLKVANFNGKKPHSKRYMKTLHRLRNAFYRHTNLKANFINKTAHILVRDYDFIGVESLMMVRMLQRKSVARWYLHKPYAAFISRLRTKALSVGKVVKEVPTNFPSSQICHCCGVRSEKAKDLSVRQWTCPNCGAQLDRDENAAMNILKKAEHDAKSPQ
ncbi:MAG: transposase [Candidatus Enteromonas sp.]|nr:transposase [Candidatus Enteromonas sp.]